MRAPTKISWARRKSLGKLGGVQSARPMAPSKCVVHRDRGGAVATDNPHMWNLVRLLDQHAVRVQYCSCLNCYHEGDSGRLALASGRNGLGDFSVREKVYRW
jgi:dTDP-4-amino-4,6-dideoxygalactose transaminase